MTEDRQDALKPSGDSMADLASALDKMRRDAGLSYSDIERAVRRLSDHGDRRLAPSTISDMLTKARISKEKLRLFLTACDIPQQEIEHWIKAWERANSKSGPGPFCTIRMIDTKPRLLGVHKAIAVGAAVDTQPTYITRDTDVGPAGLHKALDNATTTGGFFILIGRSSVGKTRSAFEAARTVLPNWWLFHPNSANQIEVFAEDPTPRTIIWLDEIQRYLGGPNGLTAAMVRALLHTQTPLILLGTLWADRYTEFSTANTFDRDSHRSAEREVIDLSTIVHLDAKFSPAEKQRALNIARSDPQIGAVVGNMDTIDYGLTQAISGVPHLIDHWKAAGPLALAVIEAAIDAYRLGIESPLRADLLRNAAPAYCSEKVKALAPPNWFADVIAYLTQQLRGATTILTPVARSMGNIHGYILADYIAQQGTEERKTRKIGADAWQVFVTHVTDSNDIKRLAFNAECRLLYRFLLPLLRRSVHAGDQAAAIKLSKLMALQNRLSEAMEVLERFDDEENLDLTVQRTLLYVQMGSMEKAVAAIGGIPDTASVVMAYENVTSDLIEMGSIEQAIAFLGKLGGRWRYIRSLQAY